MSPKTCLVPNPSKRLRFRRIALLAALASACSIGAAHADVPSSLEPAYSEAVLAYNAKDYAKAVALLDSLIHRDANVAEFLELKALSLKMMKDPARAAEAYHLLIKIKTAANRPEGEIAPYHFELGQLLLEKEDLQGARDHFTAALHSSFNVPPSHFFLGLIYYRMKDYDQSEAHFHGVLRGDVEDLKPSANYYLGQIALQTRYTPGATQSFFAARRTASEQMSNDKTSPESKKIAQQVYEAATTNLQPFNHDKVFGNVSLISGYDSNVLSVPSGQDSTAQGGSGHGSGKETLQAGIGYMTSPLNSFQFVPSYKGSFNYDFNRDTREGQFITHDLSLYVTRNALAATSYGFKIEGIYVFQDQVDSSSNSGTFKPYSLGVAFGPYFKKELSRKLTLNAEVDVTPTKNYLDSSLPDVYHRSGADLMAKVGLKSDTGARYWNPGAYVGIDREALDGAEYKSTGFLMGVNDGMHVSDATQLAFAVDFSPVSYSDRPEGSRKDKVLSLDGNISQKMSEKITVMGEIQYIDNMSNVADIYQYNRLMVSAGLAYSL